MFAAIREWDGLGEAGLVARYGLTAEWVYELRFEGRVYNARAILDVAHRIRHGSPYVGERESHVARQFERLEFEVKLQPLKERPGGRSRDLRECIGRVLECARDYRKWMSARMRDREAAIHAGAAVLREVMASVGGVPEMRALELAVDAGGQQAQYAPVPWIRVYSGTLAPTVLGGFCLMYLFAADGSRAYLSLNQGASEHRAGAIRPINDRTILRDRAIEARAALGGLETTSVGRHGRVRIDLARPSTSSGRQIGNYEAGNIIAYEYDAGDIPSHSDLIADVAGMLPILGQLYGVRAVRSEPDAATSAVEEMFLAELRRQGMQQDRDVRSAIERYAEDRAAARLERDGWRVDRVGSLNRGYDLECRQPGDRELHVEVKGSQTRAEEVTLTVGEVRHNQSDCAAEHALYVVGEIETTGTADGIACHGGRDRYIVPWTIDPRALRITQYSYTLP